ncbi:MAG TPA: PA2778 family cysteine peptidase [Steroidobacter sp.]|nr:PA2778 family cysteine peptidase [Steroidobacter sp.]
MIGSFRQRPEWIAIALIAILSGCAAHPPQAAFQDATHLPTRSEIEQTPFYKQEQYQCGPAALATALSASGVIVEPEELAAEVYLPGRKGSLQVELAAAARARDRVAYTLAPRLTDLLEQVAAGNPVLLMQNLGLKLLPAWHFAVLVGYDRDAQTVILRSGTTPRLAMDVQRFMRTWDRAQRWAILILPPDRLPAHPELDRYMAAVASLESTGRLDAAERAYLQARGQWPQSVWPALGLANVSYARGELRKAETGYLDSLALDPQNVVAHNNLSEILLERGCVTQARSHIERATQLAKGTSLEVPVASTARHIAAASAQDSGASCPQP